MASIRRFAGITAVLVLLGACLWISFNYLIWFLPAQPGTRDMALADLDGDGDLDAFLANGRNEIPEPNTVLVNDGKGNFQDSGQRLGNFESWGVVLHDFDDDGDMDALVSNISWGEYFWNDGDGSFTKKQSIFFPNTDGYYVGIWRFKAADLNGDNRADLFLNGCCGGAVSMDEDEWQTINAFNTVWLGDERGLPGYTGQKMGLGNSEAVALGDLDGDGDLDAFTANSFHLDETGELVHGGPNQVWLNDGAGVFADSGQKLGSQSSFSIAVGDLDGDGDLDALVGNRGPDEVWLNDGLGNFTDSGQTLGNSHTRFVYLADLDNDGDLDAFTGGTSSGRLWFNDGEGRFKAGQKLSYSRYHAPALGDVDGNGTVDIISARVDTATVWYNNGTGHMEK